jgi:hypothetical protein
MPKKYRLFALVGIFLLTGIYLFFADPFDVSYIFQSLVGILFFLGIFALAFFYVFDIKLSAKNTNLNRKWKSHWWTYRRGLRGIAFAAVGIFFCGMFHLPFIFLIGAFLIWIIISLLFDLFNW